MVELTPEIKAQLEKQKEQCIFCKIVKGEFESKKVFEDKEMISVLDINPAAKGHMLLLPKEHYPILPYMPAETFKHFFGIIPRLVESVKAALLCTGVNVFIANGAVAGQQSPHFLAHLIPREIDDQLTNFDFENKAEDDEEIIYVGCIHHNRCS